MRVRNVNCINNASCTINTLRSTGQTGKADEHRSITQDLRKIARLYIIMPY